MTLDDENGRYRTYLPDEAAHRAAWLAVEPNGTDNDDEDWSQPYAGDGMAEQRDCTARDEGYGFEE